MDHFPNTWKVDLYVLKVVPKEDDIGPNIETIRNEVETRKIISSMIEKIHYRNYINTSLYY
jgi:hypothetical protein